MYVSVDEQGRLVLSLQQEQTIVVEVADPKNRVVFVGGEAQGRRAVLTVSRIPHKDTPLNGDQS